MRRWCDEKEEEQRKIKNDEEEEDRLYAEYVLQQDDLCMKIAEEEAKDRHDLIQIENSDNKESAKELRKKKKEEMELNQKLDRDGLEYAMVSPFLCEETNCEIDWNKNKTVRVRADHSKDLTKIRLTLSKKRIRSWYLKRR